MAKFRMVHTTFWDDPKVVEELTPEDKLFFLYLLTNPNSKQIGICQLTKKQMAFDIGYSPEAINSLMQRFTEYHKLIRYNPETRELAIKNWGRYNLTRGGKPVLDCVRSELKEVKDLSLIEYVANGIERPEIKALYDTYYDTSTTSGQEEEKEKEEYKEEEEAAVLESNLQNQKEQTLVQKIMFSYQSFITHLIDQHTVDKVKNFIDVANGNESLIVYAMERANERVEKFQVIKDKPFPVPIQKLAKSREGLAMLMLRQWMAEGITDPEAAKAFEESNDPANKRKANSSKGKFADMAKQLQQ